MKLRVRVATKHCGGPGLCAEHGNEEKHMRGSSHGGGEARQALLSNL